MKPFRYLSSVGLACLPLLALAVGQWVSFALDNRVSVRLPGKPTSLKMAADEAAYPANRFCAAKDAQGIYVLIRTDITAPDMVDNAPQRRLFYDDYVDIQLRGLQDGVLLRRGPVIIGGQEGVDIQFTGTIRSSGRRVVRYSRGLILDKVLYSFAFTPQDTLSPARASAAASSFFRGISVR